jgi:hypothetical protein
MPDAVEQAAQAQDAKPLKDWRKIITASALPDDVKRLIETVVRKTRLWKRERASVARELIAHFHDAADAGVSSEEAIKRFGDAKQAARLIRRAKIRNRSWLWHARRFVQRVIGVLILCYIGVGVYYYSGRPTQRVDFVAVLNDRLPKVAEEERAWPFYRDALLSIPGGPENYPEARPGEEQWPDMAKWLREHRELVAKLRTATTKPALGLPYSLDYGPQDQQLLGRALANARRNGWGPEQIKASAAIYALPHTIALLEVSKILSADALLAAQEGDTKRAQANLFALLDLGQQIRHRDFLITDLIAVGFTLSGIYQTGTILAESPELFDDEFLVAYAHRLAAFQVPADLVRLRGERLLYEQMLQNVYTDDGNGDGRITPFLSDHVDLSPTGSDSTDDAESAAKLQRAVSFAAAPTSLFSMPSRKQMLERYDASLASVEAAMRRPYRERREALRTTLDQKANAASPASAMSDIPFSMIDRTIVTAERILAQADATVVALALERWRREHGRYPERLDALVPDHLPTVPADRVDGAPLRYLLKDRKPLIYSVGSDGDDDGGRVPVNSQGEERQEWGTLWSDRDIDGDWIIFPPR